jgi:hypothetical protein
MSLLIEYSSVVLVNSALLLAVVPGSKRYQPSVVGEIGCFPDD